MSTLKPTPTADSASPIGAAGTETSSPSKYEQKRESGSSGDFVMLPWPVSSNRYWRNFRGRMVVSKEAIEYKARVASTFRAAGYKPLECPVSVALLIHPKLTTNGAASKVRQDIDNQIKVIFDGLNGVAWVDDSQVWKLSVEIALPIDGGGVSVLVSAR